MTSTRTSKSAFTDMLATGYGREEPSLILGAALEGSEVHQQPKVKLPLSTTNRHGLVAGATGTGKTTTLRLLTEQLSAQGVPVFVADMKGDLSGLAMPGEATDRVSARAADVGWDWKPKGVPVEFVSLTGALGVQLRATVSSFGPLLLGKVLSLNALQAHTPDDDTALKATVRTFPKTSFYDLEETLTSLGIGEAVVTVLDSRGSPTPVVATRLIPPASRMAPLTPEELQADIRQSDLLAEYGKAVDRESAREILAARMGKTAPPAAPAQAPEPTPSRAGKTIAQVAAVALSSSIARTVGREVVRGIFGLLGAKPPRTTRRRSRW